MHRVRLKYEKKGTIRFASHRDLMRVFRRAFASAEIPVSFSQGFNPHPRLSFGPSLRTGWESEDEYLDAYLESLTETIPARCAPYLPDGLRLVDSGVVGESVPKLSADVSAARYAVFVRSADLAGGVPHGAAGAAGDALTACESWAAGVLARFGDSAEGRPSGEEAAARPRALEARCERFDGGADDTIMIEYLSTMHGGRSLFPEDVLAPVPGAPDGLSTPSRVLRKALYVERDGRYVSPLSRAALETKR